MFENKLHTWTRLQQNCKLVKGGQLTVQSDAVYEEHVYRGLVVYEHPQKNVLYGRGCGHVRGPSDRSFDCTGDTWNRQSIQMKCVTAALRRRVAPREHERSAILFSLWMSNCLSSLNQKLLELARIGGLGTWISKRVSTAAFLPASSA
jgi:hypothetical protein